MTTPKTDGAADSTPRGPDSSQASPQLQLKLDVFEGPLDLLLHLIRKSEIDVTDIPIVEVTRQYMEYLDFMKQLDLGLAGDYLVMAATLIHIKSKMLLPPEPTDDAQVVEAHSQRPALVASGPENIKITTAADLKLVESIGN